MRRTTIMAPAELLQRLRQVAAERGTSLASLIREALEEKVRHHRPRPRSVGIGASGHTDTARRTADERPEPHPWH
jgi:hypothetical protein